MADIELVIKIPKSTYKVFKNLSKIIGVLVYEKDILTLIKAVKNGTPLPEGHGRIDNSSKIAILTEIQSEIEGLSTQPAYQDEDYFLIGTQRCSELIQKKINKLKEESENE